jgi:hypothetical protein
MQLGSECSVAPVTLFLGCAAWVIGMINSAARSFGSGQYFRCNLQLAKIRLATHFGSAMITGSRARPFELRV